MTSGGLTLSGVTACDYLSASVPERGAPGIETERRNRRLVGGIDKNCDHSLRSILHRLCCDYRAWTQLSVLSGMVHLSNRLTFK